MHRSRIKLVTYRPYLALFCLVLILFAWSGRLSAAPYPVAINIKDETDIEQLYRDGEIDEEAKNRLLVLYYTKIDLNLATRDELYELPAMTYTLADEVLELRKKRGRFARVHDLAGAKGMTPAIYDQVRPFVTVKRAEEMEKKYDAQVRTGAIYRTHGYNPAFYLRGKARFKTHGGVGLLVAARPMIGTVNDVEPITYYSCSAGKCKDVNGESLTAAASAIRFDPAGLYVFWDGARLSAIAGSFRVGYGLGLTMDNSKRKRPFGWYPNIDFSEDEDSGKMKPYEGFVGAAVRYKQIDIGSGWLDIGAFGSFWLRDMYQTDLRWDRDPDSPFIADEELSYNSRKDVEENQSLYFEYPTLPWIMREIVGGGNVTYWFNRRSLVGVTGYGANWKMTAKATNFGPSAFSSKYPFDRNTWGAIGINTKFGFGRYDFAGELAFTDRGDPGMLLKAWLHPLPDLVIIPSFRYYSPGYDNPYNLGEANADEHMGNRARDELGGKVKITYRPIKMLRLRLDINVWHHQFPGARSSDQIMYDLEHNYIDYDQIEKNLKEDPSTDLELLFRVGLRPTSKERVSFQVVYHDEALDLDGRERSYEMPTKTYISLWGGTKLYWSVMASTKRIPRITLTASFKQIFEDSYKLADTFDHHWYAWLRVSANLSPGPRLVARIKYYDESTVDLSDRFTNPDGSAKSSQYVPRCNYELDKDAGDLPSAFPGRCREESYIDVYVQASQRIPMALLAGSYVRLRLGWTHWTDQRKRWAQSTVWDANPTRDEFLIKGYLLAKF